eukprot:17838-Pelagomonas_calceolata.AAC.4
MQFCKCSCGLRLPSRLCPVLWKERSMCLHASRTITWLPGSGAACRPWQATLVNALSVLRHSWINGPTWQSTWIANAHKEHAPAALNIRAILVEMALCPGCKSYNLALTEAKV